MSNWWAFLDWYENLIVYPLALAALVLLLKARSLRGRAIVGTLLVLLFLPHIQKAAGGIYFDYLCRTQAGEFIYRTVDNVEGILQMRPRDGSKDYFDRMRAGDIPEDPYGHTNVEAQWPWSLIGAYKYFESVGVDTVLPSPYWKEVYHDSMFALPDPKARIARFFRVPGDGLESFRKEFSVIPKSKYGFTWNEVRGTLDRAFNVYGGEILVKELENGNTLAAKRGFYRVRPARICSDGKDDFMLHRFLERVVRPPPLNSEPLQK